MSMAQDVKKLQKRIDNPYTEDDVKIELLRFLKELIDLKWCTSAKQINKMHNVLRRLANEEK